jgi:xylulose-5-phosphate/fructose-6-phosphate phosphoketolase
MIVLRTPKGWTGPKMVDGLKTEGSWRSHQVPLAGLAEKPTNLAELERWMRSYRPDELFDLRAGWLRSCRRWHPRGDGAWGRIRSPMAAC